MTRVLWAALVLAVLAGATFALLSSTGIHGSAPLPRSLEVPPAGVTLPMDTLGGRPLVQVRINSRGPYRFILDTGAHVSVVDASLARELSLPVAPGVHAAPVGGVAPPEIVLLDELDLGQASVGGLIAAAVPLQHMFPSGMEAPRGVLSASIFSGQLVTFDYPGRTISIRPGSLPEADDAQVFAYGDREELPSLPVRVAGHLTRVHLDTGSGDGLTLPRRWLEELPLASAPVPAGTRRTPGHEATMQRAAVKGGIQVGRYTLDSTAVLFGDVQAGNLRPIGNLGWGALRSFVVTLDPGHRRIRFSR